MKAADKQYLIDQCRDYRERATGCEVSHLLRVSEDFKIWERGHKIGGYACHHIAGRDGRQKQAWANLILVSTAAHEFGHQRGVKDFNVGHAFEAACLLAKHGLQQKMMEGPVWLRETEQHRQHFCHEQLDAIRRTCVGWTSLADRVDMLCESLDGTVFGDVALKLRAVVDVTKTA